MEMWQIQWKPHLSVLTNNTSRSTVQAGVQMMMEGLLMDQPHLPEKPFLMVSQRYISTLGSDVYPKSDNSILSSYETTLDINLPTINQSIKVKHYKFRNFCVHLLLWFLKKMVKNARLIFLIFQENLHTAVSITTFHMINIYKKPNNSF